MGLGPPVCASCMVIGGFDVDTEVWFCPICGSEELDLNMSDCGLTEQELKNNRRFLNFVKGFDDAPTDR